MSLYAKVENNTVTNVVVCDDLNIGLLDGNFIKITDSTNNPSIGATYNSEKNKFINNSMYESWVLNEETCVYEAPVPKPESGEYYWNEEDQEWIELVSGIEA
jgi:hypothetical protein